jgi:hypothetical protein
MEHRLQAINAVRQTHVPEKHVHLALHSPIRPLTNPEV